MVPLEILRKSDVFSGLTDDELVAIAQLAHEETYEAGAQVFLEHGPARYLYLVVEGRVVIMINIARDRQAVIDTVSRGGSFGWSAMVPPYVLTGTAKAVDRVRVVAVPGDELRGMCRLNCTMCYTIMERLATLIARRLSETRLQLLSVMYH